MKRPVEKVTIRHLNDKLPIEEIEVADANVRKAHPDAGLDELINSIQRFGLIQPVIVMQTGPHKYKLIVGQRRLRAFQEMGRRTIPALIINRLNAKEQQVVSFAENIHRRNLPFEDTIRICTELFKQYGGTSRLDRIRKISEEIGIPIGTVSKYIGYGLIPAEVRQLVTEGRLTRDQARRITQGFWPNKEKIIRLANRLPRMRKEERQRLLAYGTKNPEASVDELLEEALKPQPMFELVIPIEIETYNILEQVAKQRGTDVATLVKERIEDALPELKDEIKPSGEQKK